MALQKETRLKKIFRLVLVLGAVVCFINAFGCVYMQRQLKLNAENVLHQILDSGAQSNIEDFTVTSSVLGLVSSATLHVTQIAPSSVGNNCAAGTLQKNGRFGFIFSLSLGPPQEIEVCSTK